MRNGSLTEEQARQRAACPLAVPAKICSFAVALGCLLLSNYHPSPLAARLQRAPPGCSSSCMPPKCLCLIAIHSLLQRPHASKRNPQVLHRVARLRPCLLQPCTPAPEAQ